jgi:hypothetical protein
MGDSTSNYATADIALRVSAALKPHHHDKMDTPSVGSNRIYMKPWNCASQRTKV